MLRRVLSMVPVGLLAACAAGQPAPQPAPQPTAVAPGVGWRKGVVVEVGDRDSLGPPIDGDCRASSRASADPLQRFVEVRYFVGRHAHHRIVPIDATLALDSGDTIWFRSFGCVDARATAPDR